MGEIMPSFDNNPYILLEDYVKMNISERYHKRTTPTPNGLTVTWKQLLSATIFALTVTVLLSLSDSDIS